MKLNKMIQVKRFEQFLNEGKIIRSETITVEYHIEYHIDSQFAREYSGGGGGSSGSEQDLAEGLASDVNLKKGYIEWEGRNFEIRGETEGGNQLIAIQEGEYDMYGGPYDPKMKAPDIKLNGKNIVAMVKKEFDKYGWDTGKANNIDISRTDIWGHIVK